MAYSQLIAQARCLSPYDRKRRAGRGVPGTAKPQLGKYFQYAQTGVGTEEYTHYCKYITGLIRPYAKRPASTLLDIGCGGGKNDLIRNALRVDAASPTALRAAR